MLSKGVIQEVAKVGYLRQVIPLYRFLCTVLRSRDPKVAAAKVSDSSPQVTKVCN